ncbi:hypothetical protein TWF281_000428 [Arthrobotrys megalospora]
MPEGRIFLRLNWVNQTVESRSYFLDSAGVLIVRSPYTTRDTSPTDTSDDSAAQITPTRPRKRRRYNAETGAPEEVSPTEPKVYSQEKKNQDQGASHSHELGTPPPTSPPTSTLASTLASGLGSASATAAAATPLAPPNSGPSQVLLTKEDQEAVEGTRALLSLSHVPKASIEEQTKEYVEEHLRRKNEFMNPVQFEKLLEDELARLGRSRERRGIGAKPNRPNSFPLLG